MSPILTRPVREQLEHDRVIRLLQARYERKNEVVINPGNEQNQSITVGELVVFPDLLVFAADGRRLMATVEVETGESVNAIEARAEWGVYSKVRVPLHLYVPPACVDAARRMAAEYQIIIAELWTYTTNFDQVRFNMVHRDNDAPMARVNLKPNKPAPKPVAIMPPAVVAKPTPVTTLREAQDRFEQSRATKPTAPPKVAAPKKPVAKAELAPLPQAQGRPELSRGTKAKAKAAKAKPVKATPVRAKAKVKAKPVAKKAAPKSKARPKAKPATKKGAKKRR